MGINVRMNDFLREVAATGDVEKLARLIRNQKVLDYLTRQGSSLEERYTMLESVIWPDEWLEEKSIAEAERIISEV